MVADTRLPKGGFEVQPTLQSPIPWEGTVTNTQDGVHGLVLQYIWGKNRRLISELTSMELEDSEEMHRESTESLRGLLVYVARTYRDMNNCFKGLNFTLDSWRLYRDQELWRLQGE